MQQAGKIRSMDYTARGTSGGGVGCDPFPKLEEVLRLY